MASKSRTAAVVLTLCGALFAGGVDNAAADDPTRPPGVAEPGQEAALPQVDMVRLGRESRLARIEGRWRAEGERLGALRIEQIHANRVVFRGESEHYTVPVLSEEGVQMQRSLPRHPGGNGL